MNTRIVTSVVFAVGVAAAQGAAAATIKANPNCPEEAAYYDPSQGEDIVVPEGYKVEVFARDLNSPTGIAFLRDGDDFKVLVVESGTGLPGACNTNTGPGVPDKFASTNPFTPDVLVFDRSGNRVAGPLFKPTPDGGGYQLDGPAIGIAFENGAAGGRLFLSDSNQQTLLSTGATNSSRISVGDLWSGKVTPFITGLPNGDHPTEMLEVKDGYLYWSQGSATNSAVVGHDNGGGKNQHDIACQDITLGTFLWDSGDGHLTSGYSWHNQRRPGAVVKAFEDATQAGMCTGAILRVPIDAEHPAQSIQPYSWGYRNPFGLRFAPEDHALKGALFVTENGEDERGARPTNGSPDRLQIARMNPDGTPDYHGWPDRLGFLDVGQKVFQPIGGANDDNAAAVVGKPIEHVLAYPPQPITAPLAIETADTAVVQPDFAPASFTGGIVKPGAVLVPREGDLGFSPEQSDPSAGHDIEIVNFSAPGAPLNIQMSRFAFNCPAGQQTHVNGAPACNVDADQAFSGQLRGINRPTMVKFGPDGALYLVDYGIVRDPGASDPDTKVVNPKHLPFVQVPGTGVIWKITKVADHGHDHDRDHDHGHHGRKHDR